MHRLYIHEAVPSNISYIHIHQKTRRNLKCKQWISSRKLRQTHLTLYSSKTSDPECRSEEESENSDSTASGEWRRHRSGGRSRCRCRCVGSYCSSDEKTNNDNYSKDWWSCLRDRHFCWEVILRKVKRDVNWRYEAITVVRCEARGWYIAVSENSGRLPGGFTGWLSSWMGGGVH